MEIVQGKSTDKKIVVAQEIAFAKVLAGNNKTLRDRAVKKLKNWLSARGNGKWDFSEDEFIRIWTGLFYCMWMSDKFLVQEELAENISHLIHCFKKNSDNALLFIKCFNKRLLMEWEGLDQYRIDKFEMLIRRFLRQTFEYCKRKDWDEAILKKLMRIFSDIVLHKDNSLGFILHFINIYPEELAKVSKGKLKNNTVLTVIEPFVKLVASTKDERILNEASEFFVHLMKQTDIGIDFEEQFHAWKQQGFPGPGPDCMKKTITNGHDLNEDSDEDLNIDDDENDLNFNMNTPMDPRAGSVHVTLPQIPIDIDGIINLLKKYEKSNQTGAKGRKKLRIIIQKFLVLKKGKFPEKIRKDPILEEKTKKKRETKRRAKELLEFTDNLENGPITTEEFLEMSKELENQDDEDESEETNNEYKDENEENFIDKELSDIEDENENDNEETSDDLVDLEEKYFKNKKNKSKLNKKNKIKGNEYVKGEKEKKLNKKKKKKKNGVKENTKEVEGSESFQEVISSVKKIKRVKKLKKCDDSSEEINENQSLSSVKNMEVVNELKNNKNKKCNESFSESIKMGDLKKVTPVKKTAIKRKILSNWQVQDLDPNSPEYSKIETQKIIRLEKKLGDQMLDSEENLEPVKIVNHEEESKPDIPKEKVTPVFWEKAKSKATKKSSKGTKVLLNSFSELNGEAKSSGLRRISFALEKNMAQENEEYLEEVRNSPKVPFDGTKKPVQSALKIGLAPSPVNPFYRFKKIKF